MAATITGNNSNPLIKEPRNVPTIFKLWARPGFISDSGAERLY